jgi:hypothetical protein
VEKAMTLVMVTALIIVCGLVGTLIGAAHRANLKSPA